MPSSFVWLGKILRLLPSTPLVAPLRQLPSVLGADACRCIIGQLLTRTRCRIRRASPLRVRDAYDKPPAHPALASKSFRCYRV